MTDKTKENEERVRKDQDTGVDTAEELLELMKNWCVPQY